MVIAIIAILMTAGIGLLRGTSGQAAKVSAGMLESSFEKARVMAVTTRSRVVLAIAEPGDLPTDDKLVRIGILKVDPEGWHVGGSGTNDATLTSRWNPLENGVVPLTGAISSLENVMDGSKLTLSYGPAGNKSVVKVHALVFSPLGRLEYPEGSAPLAFGLAEGHYADGKSFAHSTGYQWKIGRVIARAQRIDG